ncbi:MAG: DUF599 domain-containing protein [Burkholderiales bacterium]
MQQTLIQLLGNDLIGFALSAAILVAYHLFLRHRLKTDPAYTIQAVNATARLAWVESVMGREGHEVLAVQTLRNAIMGPTFLGSTAVVLMIGTLTLISQGDKLEHGWHALNVIGAVQRELWLAKVLLLLLDFLIAFMCFAQAIRLFVHVGFMINVSAQDSRRNSPQFVGAQLNRAGHYHWLGMRAYYLAVPLAFWLFGPHFMLAASIIEVVVLHHLDHAPS